MKKVMLGLLLLSSISVFAQEQKQLKKSSMMCRITLQESLYGNDVGHDSYFEEGNQSGSVSLRPAINVEPYLLQDDEENKYELRARFSIESDPKLGVVELFKVVGDYYKGGKETKLLDIKILGSGKKAEAILDKDVARIFKSATLTCISND